MENSAEVVIGIGALVIICLAAFVAYRWRRQRRVRQIEKWVKEYLCVRYGELPDALKINCSNDPLWPVLVAFDAPRTGVRHRLRFACGRAHSAFALVSEQEDKR